MRMVQKYGGTSVGTETRIQKAASRAVSLANQGHQVVLVVSAQGHTTDELLGKAQGIDPRGSDREMDACLSAGEQISAALMAMAIQSQGKQAVSLSGWQAGIQTDGVHADARILAIDTSRLERELEAGKIVVVAGFQGLGPNQDVTTLGRGGSDTTAVALAAWLKADKCQIFTDVDGVYDRDPRKDSQARKFTRIGYDAMLELMREGAQVLHDRSVELAKAYKIPVEVLSAFSDAPGTLVE